MITEHYHKTIEKHQKLQEEESRGNLGTGLAIVMVGLILSIGSYLMATPGQSYMLFIGLIIYGFITIFK